MGNAATNSLGRNYAPTVYAAACKMGFCYMSWHPVRTLPDGESVMTLHTARSIGWGDDLQPGETALWVGWDHARRCFVFKAQTGPVNFTQPLSLTED